MALKGVEIRAVAEEPLSWARVGKILAYGIAFGLAALIAVGTGLVTIHVWNDHLGHHQVINYLNSQAQRQQPTLQAAPSPTPAPTGKP